MQPSNSLMSHQSKLEILHYYRKSDTPHLPRECKPWWNFKESSRFIFVSFILFFGQLNVFSNLKNLIVTRLQNLMSVTNGKYFIFYSKLKIIFLSHNFIIFYCASWEVAAKRPSHLAPSCLSHLLTFYVDNCYWSVVGGRWTLHIRLCSFWS